MPWESSEVADEWATWRGDKHVVPWGELWEQLAEKMAKLPPPPIIPPAELARRERVRVECLSVVRLLQPTWDNPDAWFGAAVRDAMLALYHWESTGRLSRRRQPREAATDPSMRLAPDHVRAIKWGEWRRTYRNARGTYTLEEHYRRRAGQLRSRLLGVWSALSPASVNPRASLYEATRAVTKLLGR